MIAPEQARALAAQILGERENIERLWKELTLDAGRSTDPLYLRAVASILHDFYNGVERILSAIVRAMNTSPPAGPDWHLQLLLQASREVPGVRPAILPEDARRRLLPYLEFRHRFRHMYGFELEWARLEDLATGAGKAWESARPSIQAFERFLISIGDPPA